MRDRSVAEAGSSPPDALSRAGHNDNRTGEFLATILTASDSESNLRRTHGSWSTLLAVARCTQLESPRTDR